MPIIQTVFAAATLTAQQGIFKSEPLPDASDAPRVTASCERSNSSNTAQEQAIIDKFKSKLKEMLGDSYTAAAAMSGLSQATDKDSFCKIMNDPLALPVAILSNPRTDGYEGVENNEFIQMVHMLQQATINDLNKAAPNADNINTVKSQQMLATTNQLSM